MLQLIGTRQDKETRKAERWLKERRIEYQFVDLKERRLSPREWASVFRSVKDKEELVDASSDYYKKNGYQWRDYDVEEEVMEHVELLKKPVLRMGDSACVGFSEEWLKGKV
ncbi:MAG: arsenate reductase family protein [Candidatus Ornithospirochaeta sp.]